MNNNFNKAKNELALSKSFEAGTIKNPVIRLFAKSFPCIGDVALETAELAFNKYNDNKMNAILDHINKSGAVITPDMVSDVEFITSFLRILDASLRINGNEKLQYFANLLVNGHFKGSKIRNNDFDEVFYLLNNLSYREIEVGVLFYEFQKQFDYLYPIIDKNKEFF